MNQQMTEQEIQERIDDYIKHSGLVRCDFDDSCDKCSTPRGGSWVELYCTEGVSEAVYYICGNCIKERAMLDYCDFCRSEVPKGIKTCKHCVQMEAQYKSAYPNR